jgi:peptide/nickel transport system substrate-binding protein
MMPMSTSAQASRAFGRTGVRVLRTAGVLLAAGAVMTATACGGTKGGVATTSGKTNIIQMGTINPPSGFNPINQSDVGGQWALGFELDTLLVQPNALDFQPKLANSFETTDDQNFTIKLNPKATWSDGKPVTAQDVVFTLNLIANPDSATAYGGDIATFKGVDPVTGKLPKGQSKIPGLTAVDDHTVKFQTATKVDPNLVKELVGTKILIIPEHVLSTIKPADFANSDYAKSPTVTDGPYKLTKYTANVSIEFTANEKYYLGAPKIKTFIQKIMPASDLAGELQTNTIQANSSGGIGNIPIQDLKTVKAMKNVTTTVSPTIGFQTILFNTKVFKSVKMRQGLAHAINRPQMISQLLKGNGQIIDGPYTSQSPYLDKSLKVTSYDPALAKKLIKESGWDMNTKIKFLIPTGNQIREEAGDIMAQNFKDIGLNVQVTKYDFPTVLSMEQKGNYDLGLLGLTFNVDPDVTSLYASTGSFNFTGYDDPESDKLLKQGKTEPDPNKRKVIYAKLQKIWQRDMPLLSTYSDDNISAKSKSLKVGGATPFWYGTTANLQDWEFSGAQ